jgi:DNA repair protein RecO (recombination protein O)
MMMRNNFQVAGVILPSSMNTHHRTRVLLQPAYVLHRRAFRDSSLLVELFTPQYGRIGVVARAARQSSSRLSGILQPFRSLLISWSGNGELPTINAAEADGANCWLTGQVLMGGLYLNELLMRLVHRFDPHPGLYTVYHRTMQVFGDICHGISHEKDIAAELSINLECALRLFEKHLLEEIGYGLVLEYDAETGRPIDAKQLYAYHLTQGPLPVKSTCSEDDSNRLAIHGRSLLSLAHGQFEDPLCLREVKKLMRAALAEQLGERPLNSRMLFMPQKVNT